MRDPIVQDAGGAEAPFVILAQLNLLVMLLFAIIVLLLLMHDND